MNEPEPPNYDFVVTLIVLVLLIAAVAGIAWGEIPKG